MDFNYLISSFQKILLSDGLVRKDLEENLLKTSSENLETYYKLSLAIIHTNEKVSFDIRLYATLHLRNILSKQKVLDSANLEPFLENLFQILKTEPNIQISNFLSEIYGDIAAKILKDNELKQKFYMILYNDIWSLISVPNAHRIVSGLNLIIRLVESCLNEFLSFFQDNLLSITKQMLTFEDPLVLKTNIKLITKILTYAEYSYCKSFIPFVERMIEILFQFLGNKIKEVRSNKNTIK